VIINARLLYSDDSSAGIVPTVLIRDATKDQLACGRVHPWVAAIRDCTSIISPLNAWRTVEVVNYSGSANESHCLTTTIVGCRTGCDGNGWIRERKTCERITSELASLKSMHSKERNILR
jgi:hypothetical protein